MTRSIEEILGDARIAEVGVGSATRVRPDTPLSEGLRLLDEERARALVICDGERVAGIFTERDVLERVALEAVDPETPLGELMSPEVTTLRPGERLATAILAMTERGFRHVPIVDESGALAGVLSSRDVLRFIADHFPDTVLNLPPRLHQRMTRPEGG